MLLCHDIKQYMLILFFHFVKVDENHHHSPLMGKSSYAKISEGDFFPLFNCTSGTTYEVILKDSERYNAGYAKPTRYPVG